MVNEDRYIRKNYVVYITVAFKIRGIQKHYNKMCFMHIFHAHALLL